MFKKLQENIYKLDIPFYTVTTSSFAITSEENNILVDCGTTPNDVEEIIIPALNALGITPNYIFLTHSHDDHAGGLKTIIKNFPHIRLLSFNKALCDEFGGSLLKNGDEIIKNICFLSLPGHSFDSGALLDKRSKSLITGDSLQLWGIKQYGCGVSNPTEYLKLLERLKKLKIDNIFASHEYYPLGSTAQGSAEVKKYLDECESIYNKIITFALSFKTKGNTNAELIAQNFMEENLKDHPYMPSIPAGVFAAIINKL